MTKLAALIFLAVAVLTVYALILYKSANMIGDIRPARTQGQQDLRSLTERP